MEKSIDRLKVIDNIEKNITEKKFNDKVEENDPFMTEEERRELILDFDNLKTKWRNKFKANIARYIVDMITLDANQSTEIIGIENIKDLDSGAIITSNHFSKMDNTVIRYLMHKIGKRKDLFIVVQETNMKMEGEIGWLLKNCYTIPLSSNLDYLQNNFVPTLKKILDNKGFVLIYPEQEMWFNYKRPRPHKIGAYHYACKFNVPIVPCFIEMVNTDEVMNDGFKEIKYRLHVLKPIYPDMEKPLKERKEEMREKDYSARVELYESLYSRKIEDEFDRKKDIAGW